MKQTFLMLLLMAGMVQSVSAQDQEWLAKPSNGIYLRSQSSKASITIRNNSEYNLTVKILKSGCRGLYRKVYVSANSSELVTFSNSDTYFTKTKAVKNGLFGNETLYRKGSAFRVQNDDEGYTEGILDFYITTGNGVSGQGISQSEFEKDY